MSKELQFLTRHVIPVGILATAMTVGGLLIMDYRSVVDVIVISLIAAIFIHSTDNARVRKKDK